MSDAEKLFYRIGEVKTPGIKTRRFGLHFCNIKFAKKRVRATFIQGNAESMSFKNSTFDVVMLLELLDYLENPGKALDEAFRVLKPGGVIILSVPDDSKLL